MKLIFVTVENAVQYHEPDDRPAARVLNSRADILPVPVPTETTIPECADDLVFFQVRDADGKILLQLPIHNYIFVTGRDGDVMTFEKVFKVSDASAQSNLFQQEFNPGGEDPHKKGV